MKNKVQHIISGIALILVLSYTANAQTTAQKIGKNPTTIAPSAVLDIDSDNKGVLFPRVALTSTTDVATIGSPAEGLTIYNNATAGTAPNNVTPGYYYWNGTKWTKVATDSEASKWSYDAINSRVKLNKLSNGTTDRTGATSFAVHDNNILQIGDMTDVTGAIGTDKSIISRKTGNNTILNVSDGTGAMSSKVTNEIYGGTVAVSGAYLEMIKHRGTAASPEIVQNGDLISFFDFKANTGGSATRLGARMRVGIDGAVTTGSTPMRMSFETAAPGDGAPTQRFQIGSNGNVAIGTATTANAAAILDVASSNKGVLLPHVALTSTTDVTTVASPVNGLTVFNTATAGTAPNNVTPGYYYYSTADTKWVKILVESDTFTQNVYLNTADPATATIFDITNPAATNSNTLKADVANLYVGTDGSTWVYKTSTSTYVKYNSPASTPFQLANTTTDAGNNKTTAIWRSGAIGIGTNNPLTTLHVNNSLAATNTVNANAQVFRMMRSRNDGVKWENIAQFNLGSYAVTTSPSTNATSRLDLAMNDGDGVATSNVMTWQANGNVGIGITNPGHRLSVVSDVQDAGRFVSSNSGFTGIVLGNSSTANVYTRLAAGNNTFQIQNVSTNAALLHADLSTGNIGIGTTSPNAPLVVNGASTKGSFKLIAPAASAGDNWWMGFGHGTTSTDANDRARIGVDIASGGAGRLFFTTGAPASQTRAMYIDESQRVGIGTNNPTSRLEVNGAATNTVAFNAAAGTTIDFSKSNLAYTTANPGNTFTLSNIKDGGTYTLAVQGTTAGTASFTASGFTFKTPNNGLTAGGKETIYTFMVMGTKVYFYMTTGL